VVITGASSGLGEEFVRTIGTLNPKTRFFNLSRTPPQVFSGEERMRHFTADLATTAGQEAAALAASQWLDAEGRTGQILLINNSGFGAYGTFPTPTVERTVEMVDLNMRAPVVLTGRLLPQLLARGGAVINIASTAAFQPTPMMAVYGATKAFVLSWSWSLWQELRGTKVHVLCVCPGPTETNFFRAAGFTERPLPLSVGQKSPEVIQESLRALAKRRPVVVCGFSNRLMIAISNHLPRKFVTEMAYKMMNKLRVDPLKKQKG
jgi:short-subunit dehydrogenase